MEKKKRKKLSAKKFTAVLTPLLAVLLVLCGAHCGDHILV